MDEVSKRLVQTAPLLSSDELKQMNALFPSYIFRRRRTREVWTSCCGVHGELPKDHPLMDALHTPEPRPVPWSRCWHGYMAAPPEPKKQPKPVTCPFCGKVSPVKELGRTGKRDNLWDYWRVVVFRWHQGALWAMGYEPKKAYKTEAMLTAMPEAQLLSIHRFTPGKVEHCGRMWWSAAWGNGSIVPTQGMGPKFKVYEPFGNCAEFGTGYSVIGLEEIDKSPFRYCGVQEYVKAGSKLMRFLAVCTAYPRQVEMLIKAGLTQTVVDFAEREKRNAAAFNWYAEDPLEGFGLTKPELKAFMAGSRDLNVLAKYKQLRRQKLPVTLAGLEQLRKDLVNGAWFDRVTARMRRYRIGLERMRNYFSKALEEEQRKKRNKKKGATRLETVAGWWCDYIDAAEYLGYDLKNDVFLLPKGLKAHHDKATKARAAIEAKKRAEELRMIASKRLRELVPRYTYSDGKWLIRPPLNAEEIIAEGKALKHCVGGYAARHMDGVTTILFLRDRARPHRSLVTIEMKGNSIVQIHGWDDERTACKDNPKRESPRKIYQEFLDGWLAWLKGGSKRDKRGVPVLRQKKMKEEKIA